MKPGTNGRRPRGRPNRKQHGGHSRPNNFDSSGPEGRVRGNAHQVYERYLAMARDAVSASDRVAAESYYQYAEHYFRVLNSSTDPQQNDQARPDRRGGDNRQDRGRHDGQRTSGGQNREQPSASATNGQDATPQDATPQDATPQDATPQDATPQNAAPPQQPGGPETQSSQPNRETPTAVKAKGNGAEPASSNADAQPESRPDGDCKPSSV